MSYTTGTTGFNLEFTELAEEAWERAGREMRTGYDLRTARRSLNLMTIEWANRGLNMWTIEQGFINLTPGLSTYALPLDTIDLLDHVIRTQANVASTQSDLSITRISVSTYATIPNKLTQGPGFAGEKLSLNFQNIEVRALLQVIADFTNFNVVTSDTVTGTVTLRLKDVPWDQALDIILQAKGLGLRKSGNVIWIAPKPKRARRRKAEA